LLTGSRGFEAKIRHGFDAGFVDNIDVDLGGYTCVRISNIVLLRAIAKFSRYFGSGLSNGGSAGLITSFFLSWFGFLAVMTSMAELASMAPTSAGQYHWVYMLAPRSMRKLLSYLTGTFCILADSATKLTLETDCRMVNTCCLAIHGSNVWCLVRNSHPRPSCAQLPQYL
jgi:hypothetical protein